MLNTGPRKLQRMLTETVVKSGSFEHWDGLSFASGRRTYFAIQTRQRDEYIDEYWQR